jgi:hypothetical protein
MVTQTTLRPGQKGTKSLAKTYGDRLVCVRYKYDQHTGRRYTTVELIEQETDLPNEPTVAKAQEPFPSPQRLGIRVEYWERDVRDKVKAAGGIWRPTHKLWEMKYEDVVALGLESRVDPGGFSQP